MGVREDRRGGDLVDKLTPVIVDHLETRLGPLRSGWTRDPSGVELPFQVAEFGGGGQLVGSTSYATIGVSRHSLPSPAGQQGISLELVMTTHSALAPSRFPQALQLVAGELLARHVPILRGQTFALPWSVAEGSKMAVLYAAAPGYFDEGFDSVELEDGCGVAIVWMVPISVAEAEFVSSEGWDAFERLLVSADPDLLDPGRPSIV
ncbi:suppressor of fused domain protein [Solwaraspora sp. WMMD792]|uniref:suppressor of fused domain protein n=1 Tax=Solwaraspora sp. WMMD792 TaxID=3016099 RepID=UPI002417E659|nr:suppressor of fused domain protein [Solwaraspora sp. WMMD792]MDG4771996.1 suppressor of fused domain protein [Solwaraspora sp. WMMD792]